jgi:hypothetical protein
VWFFTGAMLATAVTLMFVNAWRADAAPGDSDATLVPITPCRLVDTREPGQAPLNIGEIRTVEAHGTNGPIAGSECTIPADAVGLSMNVTALNATVRTFWTIWPDGEPQPEASSLNPAPGQPPTPNAVTTSLSGAGEFNVFNNNGTVGMLIDVNGYYTKTSLTELASRLTAAEAVIATNTAHIDGLDAREPFAVTNEVVGGSALTTTPTAYVSVRVSAPVAGQVTLSSTATVGHVLDDGDVYCQIYEADLIPPISINGTTDFFQWWEAFQGGGSVKTGELSGARTFDIAANTTITYSLACEEGANGGNIRSRNLTAIFTPAR